MMVETAKKVSRNFFRPCSILLAMMRPGRLQEACLSSAYGAVS
jgi:hypothetical protein